MSFSVDVLANIAIELQRGIGHQDRFQRLITTLRQVLECDASALLRYDSRQFIPLAIDGLAKDVLGRRFALEGHPRLEAIARAGDVVRFPADSELPDPYDGLIPGQESLKVHACVGLPLFVGQNLIGAQIGRASSSVPSIALTAWVETWPSPLAIAWSVRLKASRRLPSAARANNCSARGS